MVDGASFGECFDALHNSHGFAWRTAFIVTMRTYRGGGLTKDAVYLQGLITMLGHLSAGGELEPLFIGKIAAQHIPLIRELRWRGVISRPPLRPRYMEDPAAARRLERARGGITVLDLLPRRRRP